MFAGDAKYKNVGGERIPNADLYQLLAYTTALDLPSGLLIYAEGEADTATYEVRNAGKRLEVTALDLSGTLDDVLWQVGELADGIGTGGVGPTWQRIESTIAYPRLPRAAARRAGYTEDPQERAALLHTSSGAEPL